MNSIKTQVAKRLKELTFNYQKNIQSPLNKLSKNAIAISLFYIKTKEYKKSNAKERKIFP